MGDEFGNKIGASILIGVMLLASFGIIGIGVSSELSVQEEVKATGPLQGLKAIEIDPVMQASIRDNIPRLTASERITPQSVPIMPEVDGVFPVVDTTRCVLAEFGSGIDNGSFVPSYLYALDQTMNTYARSEVAPMQLNADANSLFGLPGYRDLEYSPGDYMYGGMCDATGRQFDVPPYGLDIYGAYTDPTTGGTTLVNTGIWAVDGQYAMGDGGDTFYNDGDSSWDGRWDDAGGSGALCVEPEINTRLGDPSDFTMTLNGTFNDATDWANVSLTISAINDLDGYDPAGFTIFFWFVDDYNVVEQRTNAYENDGSATDGPSTKNYVIRNSLQKYFGLDEDMTGFLENRGDTIYYQDISFGREAVTYPTPGMTTKQWNGAEAGVICSIADGTGEHLQTVYYQFEGTDPDLAITPVDVFFDSAVYVQNETVVGPTSDGQTGPIFLANGDVSDCTLYVDIFGEWLPIVEGPDYTLNYATGEIDTSAIEPFEAGWFFHAFYNYTAGSPSVGDTVPMDITVSNAGNGIANAVVVGLYDGDPTNGGVLIDTHAAGNIPGNTAYNFVYNWDTTGYEGFHSFCVVPDHLDAIAESDNENNNIASYDIYIAPPDDVGVFDLLTFEDGLTYEYGIYDIEAIIANYGTTPQAPFDVNCQVEHLGSSVYLLNDNVEGGALPDWTPDAGWAIAANGAHTPTNSWDFGNGGYGEGLDAKLTYGPFDLSGAFASASWSWWHDYDWEAPNWDGGVLEVSPTGGAPWTRVISANGYDGAMGTGYANVLEGQDAFLAASGGFIQDSVDLTPWLGDASVWVRYWAGTDTWAGGGFGWRVDDIMISKITAGLGVLYDVTQPTTMNPMNQWDSELLTWNYNFDMQAMYRVTVSTLLGSDVVVTNDQIIADITTANIRAPFPPTDLTSQVGGAGGSSVYQETTSDIVVENNGGTIDHTLTHMPVDGTSEQIVEAVTPATFDTWNNYSVASDVLPVVEGTITAGDWQSIDENPPTGDVETIEEVFGPAITNIINGESFESAWPAGWTIGAGWARAATVTSPYHLTLNAQADSVTTDITSNVMDTSGYDPLQLDFGYLDSGAEAGEGTIWALTSGGWVQLVDVDGAAAWTQYSNTWTFGANPEYFWAGFQLEFRSTGIQANDEWAFDYVWLNGTGAGVPSLEHKWTTDSIPAGYDALNLYVRGLSSAPGDDVFSVFWSNDDVSYADTGLDIDQAAMSDYGPFAFPLLESGVLYIQVIDDNTGDAVLTTCEIDAIRLEWYENTASPPSYSLEHQWQFTDIPAADSHNFHAFVGWDGAGACDDTFAYYGSDTGAFIGEEFLMFTDTTQAIDEYTYDLGVAYTGALYVMVEDTVAGGDAEDTVYIDCMYVDSASGGFGTVNDLVLTWTLSPDDGADANDVTGYDIYKADASIGNYYEGTFVYESTAAPGTNNFIDTNAMLVADNAWYYVVATDPMYTSNATGIVSKYDPMPLTANLLAGGVNPWTGPQGTLTLTITCTISDNTTVNEYNTLVAGAEWYDTVDPGEGLGTPFALPVDGVWDGPYEDINEIWDISAWSAGTHTIYVRGNSGTGWGAPVSVDVTLTAPPYDIDLVGVLPGEWVFVSFPIEAGGNIETILDDSIIGDGGTTWDVAKWYDATDSADPWKTHRIGASTNDLVTIDNTRGVWLHLLTNGGNNALTVSQTAGYSVAAVDITLEAGWNLVGYPSASSVDADTSLIGTGADFISIYNGGATYLIQDIAVAPGAHTFTPGNAYWIHVPALTTWSVQP